MSKARIPKDLRLLVRRAQDEGWVLDVTAKMHPRLTSPDGRRSVVMASSPRSVRSCLVNFRRDLRKAGLDLG